MRKYIHISFCIITCLVIKATAQTYPSYESPLIDGYPRGNEALSGAVERLSVIYGETYWTNYFDSALYGDYFKQYQKLTATKAMLNEALRYQYWIDPANTTNANTFDYFSPSSILQKVGAPLDYWTNTPYFSLASSSNGFRFLPAIMSNMVALTEAVYEYEKTNYSLYIWTGYSTNSIDDAYNNALTNMTEYAGDGYDEVYSQCTKSYSTYGIDLHRKFAGSRRWSPTISGDYAELFGFVGDTFYYSDELAFGGTHPFDAQGDNVDTNYVHYMKWTNDIAGTSPWFDIQIDPTNNPPPNYSTNADFLGWAMYEFYNSVTVYQFNITTNGFKWFR